MAKKRTQKTNDFIDSLGDRRRADELQEQVLGAFLDDIEPAWETEFRIEKPNGGFIHLGTWSETCAHFRARPELHDAGELQHKSTPRGSWRVSPVAPARR